MIYVFITLTFVLSVMVARIIIPRILLISIKKKLFDIPDSRKVHKGIVPRLGGVSFFPTVLFSVAFTMAMRYLLDYRMEGFIAQKIVPEALLFVCGLTLLYLIGIADDLIGVRYRQKFLIQIVAAAFLPVSGLWINNFYGLFGIHALPAFIGIPFTMFLVVFITNAINLIDGIDGLASGLSSVALLVFGFLFMHQGLWAFSMLSFATLGVLIPFFYYNVFGNVNRGRKIFMGDTGSLTLGYIISFLAVTYSMYDFEVAPYVNSAIVISFSVLIVPMFDVIRVILVRARTGKNIFEPDKNHIHHKFLAMGLSHKKAMVGIIGMACVFAFVNIALVKWVNVNVLFVGDIVVWIGVNVWFDRVRDRKLIRNIKKV